MINTRPIEKTLSQLTLELQNGDHTQKHLGQKLAALAIAMEEHRVKSEKPITADTLPKIRIGKSKL